MTQPQSGPGDQLRLEVKIRQDHPTAPPIIQMVFSRPGITQLIEFPHVQALMMADRLADGLRQAHEAARRLAVGAKPVPGLDVVQGHNGHVPPLSQLLDPGQDRDG